MSLSFAPPPLQVPPEFSLDKEKNAFFTALINTLFQLWTNVYTIRYTADTKTTNGSATGLVQIPVATDRTVMVEAKIVARRTGGSAGTEGDSAWYVLTGAYRNVGGVMTGIATANLISGEDQVGWGVSFGTTGLDIVVIVNGAANNDITWNGTIETYEVGA